MSHDRGRKGYYGREREPEWERPRSDYRSGRGVMPRKRSRSLTRSDLGKRRSRTPRKNDKDMIDDNILSEIAKLPEPSELWENNQFQEGAYAVPPPNFQREPPNPSYAPNYQQSYSGVYDDFPPLASAPQHPPELAVWNQMALPPPPVQQYHNPEDQLKKEAAIESEMRHQKAALSKQREDYMKKSTILKKELDTLKDQRNELRGDAKRSPSPDTKRFLKENTKLQLEIQNKLKTINNVVDMLNGIIGEEAQELPESDESPERKRKSRSPTNNKKFNYVYYDPEMHWCRVCNEFPPTAKDYLNHLHSAAHHKMAAAHMEAPWHSMSGVNEGFPSLPAAPTKRTPIRGLQFFVPSTAWYCKLCDQFIGDLHCASAHLKSIVHSKNYTNFVEQNPHWETDWMSDRQKAFEKARAGSKLKALDDKPSHYTAHTITFSKDGFHTKRPKKSPSPQPDEKKKKKEKKKKSKRKRESSSSSSSQSDSSEEETAKKKMKFKNKKLRNIDVTDDKALEEWMSSIHVDRLSESDRRLLDSLKTRIKKEKDEKQRATSRDIERVTEMQKKLRESRSRGAGERDRRERWDRRDKRDDTAKKTEVKKMPFIGKMPVYKHLGKVKTEEQKKEELKKKEESDNAAKKQEMDAEIQRKVAEFKEKIARAQLERAQQQEAAPPVPAAPPPPHIPPHMPPNMPPSMPAHRPPNMPPQPPPPLPQPPQPAPAAPAPALPKDFQEALDIIFPTEPKSCTEKLQQELFSAMQPTLLGVAPSLGMQPFAPMGLMQPPGMFGFNAGLFPQPQLYDSHVPLLAPGKRKGPGRAASRAASRSAGRAAGRKLRPAARRNGQADARKREELDDLAMLGIDASDVGAGI